MVDLCFLVLNADVGFYPIHQNHTVTVPCGGIVSVVNGMLEQGFQNAKLFIAKPAFSPTSGLIA